MTLVIQQMMEIMYIIAFTLKHTLICFGPRGSLGVIAHRLSTVVRANQTLVYERTIVERGTHQELLDMGGRYYNLWERQLGSIQEEGSLLNV